MSKQPKPQKVNSAKPPHKPANKPVHLVHAVHPVHPVHPEQANTKKSALLLWNSGGNLTNTVGVNDFLRYGNMTFSENSTKLVIPFDGVLQNLVVHLVSSNNTDPAPGEGNTRTFTVRKNGVDTDLIVSIVGSAVQGENTVDLPVHKFDLISLKHNVNNNLTQSAIGIASITLSQK